MSANKLLLADKLKTRTERSLGSLYVFNNQPHFSWSVLLLTTQLLTKLLDSNRAISCRQGVSQPRIILIQKVKSGAVFSCGTVYFQDFRSGKLVKEVKFVLLPQKDY